MAAAAQAAEAAVNAIEDDDDADDHSQAGRAEDKVKSSDHELAMQMLRRQWAVRRRRIQRYRARRRDTMRVVLGWEQAREQGDNRGDNAALEVRRRRLTGWLQRRRLSCFTCPPLRRLTWPIHTAGSLALHRVWRHGLGGLLFACDTCDARFSHRYQALLHASREHAGPESDLGAGLGVLAVGLGDPGAGGVHDQGVHDQDDHVSISIAEPIVTLTVPQYLTAAAATTTASASSLDAHQLQVASHQHQLQQLQHDPQFAHQQLQQTTQQTHTMQVVQSQVQPQQVYHAQVQAADPAVHSQEAYAMDNTRITVVPVLYTCAPQQTDQASQQQAQLAPPQQPEQDPQQQQFQTPMYNGMMAPSVVPTVPKQVWYPQLATPSYYISTQFPST